jgi:4-hydroxybenzoate polyprenyltransferase/phosphoserine phosphatase
MNLILCQPVDEFLETAVQEPLVVDLDGTLLRSDLLLESILVLAAKQPISLLRIPLWLLKGKARLKHEIFSRVELHAENLPWRSGLIDYLKELRAEGRCLILATGCANPTARQMADYLNLFDRVYTSDLEVNLIGTHKRDLLVKLFGHKGFDYAADGGGNDLAVWSAARKAILVNTSAATSRAVAQVAPIDKVFADPARSWSAYLSALRPTHWLKNLLVFVPLIALQGFSDLEMTLRSFLTFLAFCLCASGGYLFNDLIDLEADRHNPQKRLRPFAAGTLPLSFALVASPLLLAAGCLLGSAISVRVFAVLVFYSLMSALYSLSIKKVVLLDVLVLASLYSLRILAGSVATAIWPSPWLLAFSTFFFFSLALVKRYSELAIMRKIDAGQAKARSYELGDAELLAAMGIASGYLSVLVFALYIATEKAKVCWFSVKMRNGPITEEADSALRAGIFKVWGSIDPMWFSWAT